jgi:two-component system, cell cycle response regulator DivK
MIDPSQVIAFVVEDNVDNMFIAMEMLRDDVGVYHVDSAVTGYEMFRLLNETPNRVPHLILLDIQIPGEDGYGVLQRIRNNALLAETLVVAVTANVRPQDIEKARRAGFDGFIGKPVHFTRFPEQIKRVLRGEQVWEAH